MASLIEVTFSHLKLSGPYVDICHHTNANTLMNQE